MSAMHSTAEYEDLTTHVSLCELRYENLEKRLNNVETRLAKVENSIDSLKTEIQQGFADIKLQIQKDNNRRSIQIIASLGAVVVAIIGAVGVWLTR